MSEAASDQGWYPPNRKTAEVIDAELYRLRRELDDDGPPADDGHEALAEIRRTLEEQRRVSRHTTGDQK